MLLLVGLGNPGERYAGQRHNVGFLAVEAIVRRHGFSPWRRRFQSEVSEGTLGGERTLALKPLTYMNESGRAVGEAMRYYRLAPEDVLVVHDELDLAPGRLRLKLGGGTAGHNGLRSLAAHIGPNFRRLRLGIGHPGDKARVEQHVLGDFAKGDRAWLEPLLEAIVEEAPLLVRREEKAEAAFLSKVSQRLLPSRKSAQPASAARPSPAPSGVQERPADKEEGPLARALRRAAKRFAGPRRNKDG